MEIKYCRARSEEELTQILELQRKNLPGSISDTEKSKEGFVTVVHTLALLEQMNSSCAHIIAKDKEAIVGYALCMHPKFAQEIDVLKPMFKQINSVIPEAESYIVMGQICIDKAYRKRGIFRQLYTFMRKETKAQYSSIITEVDGANGRSLSAHYAIGFKDLKKYVAGEREWYLISLK